MVGVAGPTVKRSESKESVASSARALTMLCHWGNCKVKEDDGKQSPYVRVRLKVSAQEFPVNPLVWQAQLQPLYSVVICLPIWADPMWLWLNLDNSRSLQYVCRRDPS